MGTNPRATNANLTGVYFDANGDVACIVHADNDDFGPHQYPGLARVEVAYQAYAAAAPPINFRGRAKYVALTRAILAHVQAQRPAVAAMIQARLESFETWIADVEAKRTAFQAADDGFFNGLTLAHKTAWNNISTLAGLATFLTSLSAAERTRYDAMIAARQAFGAALNGGPNP